MKTILVATDLSERSERALQQAIHLASAQDAALHVLYVVDEEIPGRIAKEIKSGAKETLNEQIARAAVGKSVNLTIHVVFQTIWKGIVEAAEELEADLLVLGSHRSRGMMELFRGTTVQRVAKVAKTPLLVVGNSKPGPYRDVIAGVDFSDCSRNAINVGAALAPKATMTLINVYHVPYKEFTKRADPDGSIEKRDRLQTDRELAKEMKAFEQRLESKSLKLKRTFIEGGPAPVLLEEARRRESNLICVGSHGRSWLAEAFLGSTARELLSAAPCDVLVVPL